MYEKSINRSNKLILHLRAAGKIVMLSKAFKCDILMNFGNQTVNAKSISALMLADSIYLSTEIEIIANGVNEVLAADSIASLIQADCDILKINNILINKLVEVLPDDTDFIKTYNFERNTTK